MFYRGLELEDNAVTAESLGNLADDVLDLREEAEDNGTRTDSDTTHIKKKRREEGRGFGGTLLIGSRTLVGLGKGRQMVLEIMVSM